MVIKTTSFSEIELHKHYAILRVFDGIKITVARAQETFAILKEHFKNKPFVLISHRLHTYEVDREVLRTIDAPNMLAWGIVSTKPDGRAQAALEQDHFSKNIAFFSNLDVAKDWTNTFF
jgi:hypothetical protein